MLFLFRADEKFMVQAIDQGLYWFDGTNFTFISGSHEFGSMKVHALVRRTDGTILVCTASRGIYVFDGQTFYPWKSEISEFLKYYTCNAGFRLNDSLFVFGSILNGVVFCDAHGRIQNHFNFSNGLKNNTILALFADRDQGVWIGMDDGVNYIDILASSIYYTNTSGTLGTIYSVRQNRDELYLGTNHGLFKANILRHNDIYSFEAIRMIPESQGQVWTMKEFDDQMLVGHNDGTYRVGGERLTKISDITGCWSIIPEGELLLEGTYTGLVVLDKDEYGKWKYRNRIQGYGDPTRHVEIDYVGFVWASHAMKGIYKIELNRDMDTVVNYEYFSDISGEPHNIDVFKINNRILFTNSEDLYTYDYVKNAIVPFSPLNAEVGEYRTATQIIPFGQQSYWFVNNNKIALFDISIEFMAQKKYEIILESQNIPERDIQIVSLGENVILIPDRQGFSVYDLNRTGNGKDTSALFIQKVIFQGKKKNVSPDVTGEEMIRVPYFTNNMTVFFADPSAFGQKSKNYEYRLPEFGDTWHTTRLGTFTYLNLRFGKYVLQLRSDTDSKIVELPFVIEKPWYLSRLSYGLYLVILTGLVYLGYLILRFELAKHRQLLEYEVTRKRLENELSYKSQELMFTMRYLIQKNEILTELKGEIDTLKDDGSRYPVKHVRNMEKIIRQGLESQTEEWRNAMNNLKLSEQGFFKKLLENYPNLTPNDLRLCSCLRMNFSTKEIAKLLNISGRGVEISRYRLRKKLHLGHEVNLTEFLMRDTFGDEVSEEVQE
jgi:DNA-binding CsgD family transcriptional regulator